MIYHFINPVKQVKKLIRILISPFDHVRYKKFIVLSRSRTGSNMLVSFLNSHPGIRSEGEIFNFLNGRQHLDILHNTFSKQPFFIKAKGFKIFYYHPLDSDVSAIWNTLTNINDLYVIHLKRRNVFRTLISRKIADITGIWLTKSRENNVPGLDEIKITFTPEELEKGFLQTKEWERFGDNIFSKHKLISIYYEDIIEDPIESFRIITDFLNVNYNRPKTSLQKQNTRKLREIVENYDELKSVFSKTKWHTFFDE